MKIIKSIFPRAIAVICLSSFAVLSYDFFWIHSKDNIRNGRWAGCGNFEEISPGNFEQDILGLNIRDAQPHKFILSGNLEISKKTYLTHLAGLQNIYLELKPIQYDAVAFIGIPNIIGVPLPKQEDIDGHKRIRISVPDYELFASGEEYLYPIDDYRIGFSPAILVDTKKNTSLTRLNLDVIVTNANVSNAFVVKKANTQGEFLTNPSNASASEIQKEFSTDQCALIIERPIWYKCMVLCLMIALFLPAIHILYKKDTNPGIELIAAILGVATVRSYLLGISSDWNFYPIDAALAFSVILVVIIPLWRLGGTSAQRQP